MPQTVPHHKIFWHRMREDRDCGKTLALVAMHIAADGSFLLEWFCIGLQGKKPQAVLVCARHVPRLRS